MPRKCVFYNCSSNSRHSKCNCSNSVHKSLYRFPVNDLNRLKVWLHNAGNMILESLPLPELRNKYLCEDHFDKEFVFKKEGKKNYLKQNAVPHHYNHEYIVGQTDSLAPVPSSPTAAAKSASPDLLVLTPKQVYSRRPYLRKTSEKEESLDDNHFDCPKPKERNRKCIEKEAIKEIDTPKWKKQDAADNVALKKSKTKATVKETSSSSRVPEKAQQAERLGNHVGFTCSSCYGAILGFRYSCVECVNFDLCARCESMLEHDHHYMLRVPGPRPEAEFNAMMADIRAALENRPETSQCEVEVKYEPESDDEDIKPIDPLNVPLEDTKPDWSGLSQDLLNVPTRPTEDTPGQPAPSTVGKMQQIPALAVPSATHPMLAQSRQPTTTINPLVAETVRTQTQSAAQSKGKVKAAIKKRKLTSDQGERVMVPLPFKMPKEEPLHADSGDTGDRRGCASKEADFRVFTMQNKRDDDEEFDSGVP